MSYCHYKSAKKKTLKRRKKNLSTNLIQIFLEDAQNLCFLSGRPLVPTINENLIAGNRNKDKSDYYVLLNLLG